MSFFFFQAEDGIRDLVRSRGLGDVYKRQLLLLVQFPEMSIIPVLSIVAPLVINTSPFTLTCVCLLYTSDAADERSSVDLGGRRVIKKKKYRKKNRSTDALEHNKLTKVQKYNDESIQDQKNLPIHSD